VNNDATAQKQISDSQPIASSVVNQFQRRLRRRGG
jgi:hypothetical protein